MHLRFAFSGVALLATLTVAFAEPPATNAPSGQVTLINLTPAPPQANAPAAPGAAAPSGSNGTTPAGTPVTKAPDSPAPASAPAPTAAPPSPAAATASTATPPKALPPKTGPSILDKYLGDLNDALKLSADEKKAIENDYLADGPALSAILNNPALAPQDQAQQVDDLRDKRDAKIDALLETPARRHDFYEVESRYRVALTELAADGGLIPAQPPAAVPQPSGTTPGQAESKTGGL